MRDNTSRTYPGFAELVVHVQMPPSGRVRIVATNNGYHAYPATFASKADYIDFLRAELAAMKIDSLRAELSATTGEQK